MAIKVKGADVSTIKWRENAGRAADAYATGAMAAGEDWARNTRAAGSTYHQAVTAPNIQRRFETGVGRAGAAKYVRKIESVARDRFAPGVAAAETDYKTGVEPYLATIAGLTLDPRKPKGDPANYRRVEQVGKALNSKRLALLGAGGS